MYHLTPVFMRMARLTLPELILTVAIMALWVVVGYGTLLLLSR